MNRRQKLVQQQFLNNEEAIIKRLDQVYQQSLNDVEAKLEKLTFSIGKLQEEYDWMEPDDPQRARVKSMIQSKIYQKNYQEQLKAQLDGILDKMQVSQFVSVSDYLDGCYTDGFIGTIFDAHGQGVPIMMPIDQEAMIRAVQLDSKISKGLYTRLGEDVTLLKRKITAQVSRSIATGMTFAQMAQQLAGQTRIGYNNAVRIARTEGHRIQTTATMDAMEAAKDRGADVVKQWDSTLDAKTRDSHAQVDGEVRELDKRFSNGLRYPGDPGGSAAEVINCRCALLQRARWAVGSGFTKYNGFTKQIESFDSPESYDEFKKAFFSPENKAYMNYVEQMQDKHGTRDFTKVLGKMSDREYNHYSELLRRNPIYNKNAKKELTNGGISGIMQVDNRTIRQWYVDHVSRIHLDIDPLLPMEDRARLAFEKRNAIRNEARKLMLDQDTKRKLDIEHPNPTFEDFVEIKMQRKGLTREEAIQDIYKTATKTNPNVNKELGIEGDD